MHSIITPQVAMQTKLLSPFCIIIFHDILVSNKEMQIVRLQFTAFQHSNSFIYHFLTIANIYEATLCTLKEIRRPSFSIIKIRTIKIPTQSPVSLLLITQSHTIENLRLSTFVPILCSFHCPLQRKDQGILSVDGQPLLNPILSKFTIHYWLFENSVKTHMPRQHLSLFSFLQFHT